MEKVGIWIPSRPGDIANRQATLMLEYDALNREIKLHAEMEA